MKTVRDHLHAWLAASARDLERGQCVTAPDLTTGLINDHDL